MINKLPDEAQNTIREIIAAEIAISSGNAEKYNSYIANSDNVTAVSASGRFMRGMDEVCDATVKVSRGNVVESDRVVDWISCDYVEDMAYAVFKSATVIQKENGTEDGLCWIITLIIKKTEDGWKLVHRHNTRSTR